MVLYKRQIQVYSFVPGLQGCCDDITLLTDWLDEDEGMKTYFRLKKERENDWVDIRYYTRHVQVVV